MELGLTSILSVLFLPWRNSPYVEPDVRQKYFLHVNNAGREWNYYSELVGGKDRVYCKPEMTKLFLYALWKIFDRVWLMSLYVHKYISV